MFPVKWLIVGLIRVSECLESSTTIITPELENKVKTPSWPNSVELSLKPMLSRIKKGTISCEHSLIPEVISWKWWQRQTSGRLTALYWSPVFHVLLSLLPWQFDPNISVSRGPTTQRADLFFLLLLVLLSPIWQQNQ